MLGIYIKDRLNALLSKRVGKIGEVELFSDFASALEATVIEPITAKTSIIHKQLVNFSSPKTKFYYKARQRCELADVRIIFFSLIKKEVRETLMQCKFEKDNKILANSRFSCQMNQLHLLSYKLPYRKNLKVKLFNMELTKSKFYTKTSYGIFFKNGTTYDLLVSSAPHIIPNRAKAVSNVRQAKIQCANNQISFNRFGYEVLRSDNLLAFGNLISHMLFGEKLYPDTSTEVMSAISKLHFNLVDVFGRVDEKIFEIPKIIFEDDIGDNWYNNYKNHFDYIPTMMVNVDKLNKKANEYMQY